MSKISVAMCTYNGEKYISEQLDSIINQTVKPDEIIICDDGSTDRTLEIIEYYLHNEDIVINLHINSTNLGFRKNFEKCISLCNFDVVFLSDQDDVWVNDKIESVINAFNNNSNLVYAYSDAYVTDSNLNVVRESLLSNDKFVDKQNFFNQCQAKCFPLGFSVAVMREYALDIMPFGYDHDNWLALFAPVYGDIAFIDKKLVYYRRHKNTTSNAEKQENFNIRKMSRNVFTMKYDEFFVWYNYELRDYSLLLETCIDKQVDLDLKELEGHVKYCEILKSVKNKNLFKRIFALKKLRILGLYNKYRGNRNTYIIDCLFMIINSFKINR